MKRLMTMILVILVMLLPISETMAAKAQKTPANEGESRICESPKDYKAYAKAYCKKYERKYTDDFAGAFIHAVDALPSDYTKIDKKLPKYLYERHYNFGAIKVDEATFKENFLTNVQLLKKVGEQEVQEMVNSACGYMNMCLNRDYINDTIDNMKTNWYKYLTKSDEENKYAENEIEFNKYYELSSKGVFLTDPSYVYRDANGFYRVRGRAVLCYTSATKDFQKNNAVSLNQWYYQDVEVLLNEYEVKTPDLYKRAKYVEYTWFSLGNGFLKVDKNTMKLAEKLMKNK